MLLIGTVEDLIVMIAHLKSIVHHCFRYLLRVDYLLAEERVHCPLKVLKMHHL